MIDPYIVSKWAAGLAFVAGFVALALIYVNAYEQRPRPFHVRRYRDGWDPRPFLLAFAIVLALLTFGFYSLLELSVR